MIVGNGDIASVLKDKEELLFFASGVSDSRETRSKAFQREFDLLMEQDRTKHLVYFSSLAVLSGYSPYIQHKRMIERAVKMFFPTYTIIRIGNITWGSNPHTLINFFKGQKARGEIIVAQDVFRYIVDEDEFLYWVSLIPAWSCELNIPGRRLSVQGVIDEYVK